MRERWVTFDCYGTLVDWHTGFWTILGPTAGARTAALLEAYHEFERVIQASRTHRPYKDVLIEALLRAAEKCGINVSETQARLLPQSWRTLPLFLDTEPMLAQLRAKGFRLAVLTNC